MRTVYIPKHNRVQRRVSNPLFKLTKGEADAVNQPILQSLVKIDNGVTTGTDWYNIMFFLMVGEYIAKTSYNEKTLEEFMVTYKTCEGIEERAKLTDHTVWQVTKEELEDLIAGVEAVIAMQDAALRLEVLKAHRYAKELAGRKYSRRKIMGP